MSELFDKQSECIKESLKNFQVFTQTLPQADEKVYTEKVESLEEKQCTHKNIFNLRL